MTSQSRSRSDDSPEVKTLARIQLIDGIIAIVIGLLVLISLGGSQLGFSMLIVIFGAGALVSAWGLWNIKIWAYKVAKLITLSYFFLAILALPIGFILLIINSILFLYLRKPEIKEIYNVSGFLS